MIVALTGLFSFFYCKHDFPESSKETCIVQIIFHFLWDHWAYCGPVGPIVVYLKMEFCLCIRQRA